MPKDEGSSLAAALRQIDAFGYPVSLSYNGSNTYTTPIGGVLTLLIMLLSVASVAALEMQEENDVKCAFPARLLDVKDSNIEITCSVARRIDPLLILAKVMAVWYFIGHALLGPVIRNLVAKKLWIAELGR